MKYTSKGHIVTVEFHVPTASRERAYEYAEAVADEINELRKIEYKDGGGVYYGYAQVRGIEEVTYDFDEHGDIIGHHSWEEK